jgi:hypothetical protein
MAKGKVRRHADNPGTTVLVSITRISRCRQGKALWPMSASRPT